MALKIAKRGKVSSFVVMDIMRAADEQMRAGREVLHLEVGQPATPAPKGVIERVTHALNSEKLGYTLALGNFSLRDRIARYYKETYDYKIDPDRIAITSGSSGGFILAFLSAFEPGDFVALASPGYPAYRNILFALGIKTVEILTGPETNFQPTPELIDETISRVGQVDGLIVASPSNPTGTMINPDELSRLVSYCSQKQIRLISDEIYHGITYSMCAETAARFSDDVFVINSFSKYFSMTGWRLGWMIIPKGLGRSIECLAQNLFISPPSISQIGGIAAFDCSEELEKNVKRYYKNRDLLLGQLPNAGFKKLARADGAFYIYADVSEMTDNSVKLCEAILTEAGVALTPGTDFDPSRGHHYIRLSFAGTVLEIEKAMDALLHWYKTRKKL